MTRNGWNRFRAAGCCAALLLSLVLAGCSNTAAPAPGSSTSASSSSQALSEAPASEAIPSGEEDAVPAPNVDGSENGFNGITDPAAAFAGCLGWGPGTAGTSLKSAASAAAIMDWAQENAAASRSTEALSNTLSQWFGGLDSFDQENFAEAWPLIQQTAQEILEDPDSVQPRLEDAGVQEFPTCSSEDWSAVAGALNAIVPAPQQ